MQDHQLKDKKESKTLNIVKFSVADKQSKIILLIRAYLVMYVMFRAKK